ncbi:hypothetical protein, partial [Methylobacterium nigriterrae]|uniref:hypothetical protein n=1 Tax=Methylobacterium nigriterrae TaxID=3127512 RepID=UPI003013AFDC
MPASILQTLRSKEKMAPNTGLPREAVLRNFLVIYFTQPVRQPQQSSAPISEVHAADTAQSLRVHQIARRLGVSMEVAAVIVTLAGIGP